jgi:RNA polymerase sigma-70 factor (ECF subfamily)
MAIVHHRSIDVIRKRRNESDLPTDGRSPASLVMPDVWPEVSAHLDGELVRKAVALLGPAQREVIELAYFSGLTQQEIAYRTGAPLGTVKSRVRMGLLSMRASLAPTAAARQPAGLGSSPSPGHGGTALVEMHPGL